MFRNQLSLQTSPQILAYRCFLDYFQWHFNSFVLIHVLISAIATGGLAHSFMDVSRKRNVSLQNCNWYFVSDYAYKTILKNAVFDF